MVNSILRLPYLSTMRIFFIVYYIRLRYWSVLRDARGPDHAGDGGLLRGHSAHPRPHRCGGDRHQLDLRHESARPGLQLHAPDAAERVLEVLLGRPLPHPPPAPLPLRPLHPGRSSRHPLPSSGRRLAHLSDRSVSKRY